MEKNIENINNVLKTIRYPGFSRDIISFGIVKKINIVSDRSVLIELKIDTNNEENKEYIHNEILNSLKKNFNFDDIKLKYIEDVKRENNNNNLNIDKIIAVSSCKGGVGKSTVALNLAYQLSKKYKVGLLDLDIYGPSLPTLINFHDQPSMDKNMINPIEKFGIKFMSFGFLNNENSPTIWRGPMVSRMTQQFFENVNWGKLDYLFLDLPPGTGDIQLTLVQKILLTGAIIVTTPQDLAHVDVKKGSDMFRKVNAPIIGVIENMSGLILNGNVDNNQASITINKEKISINKKGEFSYIYHIFTGLSGHKESKRLKLPLLGKIFLEPRLSESCDKGIPFSKLYPDSIVEKEFKRISETIINVT